MCPLHIHPFLQVVGASGGIFGLLGIFVADMVLNLESIHRPILQGTMISVIFVFFFYNIATQVGVGACAKQTGCIGARLHMLHHIFTLCVLCGPASIH